MGERVTGSSLDHPNAWTRCKASRGASHQHCPFNACVGPFTPWGAGLGSSQSVTRQIADRPWLAPCTRRDASVGFTWSPLWAAYDPGISRLDHR